MAKPVVFITGGGRRIGAAISSLLMESGYYVLIHVRNSLSEAQSLINEYSEKNDGQISGDIIQADLLNDDINNLIDTVSNHPKVKLQFIHVGLMLNFKKKLFRIS